MALQTSHYFLQALELCMPQTLIKTNWGLQSGPVASPIEELKRLQEQWVMLGNLAKEVTSTVQEKGSFLMQEEKYVLAVAMGRSSILKTGGGRGTDSTVHHYI